MRGTFDIYLLDVIMPGQNGIELGLSIREFDQGGRIIYLTASSDFAVDSYRAKASDYLLKPLDKSRLFQSRQHYQEPGAGAPCLCYDKNQGRTPPASAPLHCIRRVGGALYPIPSLQWFGYHRHEPAGLFSERGRASAGAPPFRSVLHIIST